MKENIIKVKSFEFAVDVTQCCRALIDRKEYVISKQLLRSGTSIGANVREALYASTRRDFAYRLSVSLRECSETIFWLELLHASKYLQGEAFESLYQKARELMRILTSIVKSLREKMKPTPDRGFI